MASAALRLLLLALCAVSSAALRTTSMDGPPRRVHPLRMGEEYASPVVELVSKGLKEKSSLDDEVTWDAPKANVPRAELAARLEEGLRRNEWFVTGRVLPELFSEDFRFRDPDVSVDGIRNYAEGVRRLFDQATARAEVLSCSFDGADTVRVAWRLSGRVNVGPFGGLSIKPYVVETDFTLGDDGLVVAQEDRFAIPSWDILLSALLPWLPFDRIPFLADPAPPVVAEDAAAS